MGFIENTDDMIVFVACICGVFGFILFLSTLFFIADKLEVFKSQKKSKLRKKDLQKYAVANRNGFQQNLKNSQHPNDDPMWFYNNNTVNTVIPRAASTDEEINDDHNATDTYINDIFSDIISENDEVQKTKIEYEKNPDPEITKKSKPSKFLHYKKSEAKKSKTKEEKEKRKIEVANESKKELKEASSKNFTMVALEAADKKDPERDFFHEEDEDKVKIMLSLEDEKIEKKVKADKSQILQYENPKLLTRERQMEEKRRNEEELKRKESKNKKMVALESNFSFGKPNMTRQESNVARRIII